MKKSASLTPRSVPRGNTQKNVNYEIIRWMQQVGLRHPAVLDFPCGNGEFLETLQVLFPGATLLGADIRPGKKRNIRMLRLDAGSDFRFKGKFDVIVCISGIMEFGNTDKFITNLVKFLKPEGTLILTNDNTFTVRDRLSYLFSGRFRRFPLYLEPRQPTYKRVPLEEVNKIFREAGLEIRGIRYTALYHEDFLFLPMALLVHFFQWLHLLRYKGAGTYETLRRMFPLKALLARHYIVFAGKKPEQPKRKISAGVLFGIWLEESDLLFPVLAVFS